AGSSLSRPDGSHVHRGPSCSQGHTEGRRRARDPVDPAEVAGAGRNSPVTVPGPGDPTVSREEAVGRGFEGADGSRGPVIHVEDVHKYYDLGETRVHALRGVSAEVRRGEFVAVMGASGSGKSTFMNILGCLDRPSSGRYLLDGLDASTLGKTDLAQIRNR